MSRFRPASFCSPVWRSPPSSSPRAAPRPAIRSTPAADPYDHVDDGLRRRRSDPRERVYIVQSGDNVNEIARAYEVTAARHHRAQRVAGQREIRPGQELKIPNVRVDSTLPSPPSTDEP